MNNLAQYPYLIVAPDYSEASAGIQVLHYFCQTINNSGGKAWIVGGTVNPKWNTPRLTEDDYAQLQNSGEPWIAVYPEVTSGNPLRAPVVVRYMLNREGVMNGNRLDFSPDDLFFWYRDEFADKEYQPALLNIDNYDLELFQDDNPHKDLDLLYINRLPPSVIEYDKLPKNLTVLSMQNPLPLEDLAKVLKRGRVLYSYESSGTCLLANLCGCPVVGLIAPGYENYAISEQTIRDNGNAGFTLVNTPEAIEHARENLHRPREQLLLRREISLVQFRNFIEKTQRKAQEKAQQHYRNTFQGWLENSVAEKRSDTRSSLALLFVILNPHGDSAAVNLTVDSLRGQLGNLPNARILLVQNGAHHDATDNTLSVVDFQHYQHNFASLVQTTSVDWLQVVPAGVTYRHDSVYRLVRTLRERSAAQAIYADEAVKHADSVTHFFKPEFNLDLFVSAPSRYLQRVFFRASAWLECGGWDTHAGLAFEFDLITKLIARYDTAAIGHYADIVNIVDEKMLTPASIETEGGIVGTFAAQRNLPVDHVEYCDGVAWRIHYPLNNTGRVSVVLTHNHDANLMTRCIASLVDNTDWHDYDIIIPVINTTDPIVLQTAREVEKLLPGKVQVLELNNCSEVQAVNIAASHAAGASLLLLDVRSVFVLKSWLNTLLNPMVRPEVACSGPKIISFDKKLISAGMIVGADNGIANVGAGEDWQSFGYQARYQCEQNYSVLNSLCLLVKKECFTQAGGLDEKYTSLEVSSAAFCLAVQKMGHVSVWTPYSIIASDNYHFMQSEYRQSLLPQMTALMEDFSAVFAGDPAYSNSLSLSSPLFTLDASVIQNRCCASPAHTPVVLLVLRSQTIYTKRLTHYFRVMEEAGEIALVINDALPALPALLRTRPATTILDAQFSESDISTVTQFRAMTGQVVHCLFDENAEPLIARQNSQPLPFDRWLVLNSALEKWGRGKGLDVLRIPDYLPQEWFSQGKAVAVNAPRRVLCPVFSLTGKERDFIFQLIEKTHHIVDWYIFGECPASWYPLVKGTFRYHANPVSVETLDALSPDAVILFRDNNHEHRFADSYAVLQYAARNITVICSDFPCFSEYDFVTKLKPKMALWTQAIDDFATKGNPLCENQEQINNLLTDRYLFDGPRQQALLAMLKQ
ncbi:glycosyltransferase family 2 protein [Kosakonia sacchari]|uniref:glycosyltransferase family 2 protein n=1 Tax=Kosakonia sacchari TaxID=1158459 RepID=UPI003F54CD4A